MLTATIFVAVSGIVSLTLALIYNLAVGHASDMPYMFLGAGIIVALVAFGYYRGKKGHFPGAIQPNVRERDAGGDEGR